MYIYIYIYIYIYTHTHIYTYIYIYICVCVCVCVCMCSRTHPPVDVPGVFVARVMFGRLCTSLRMILSPVYRLDTIFNRTHHDDADD